MATSDLPTWAPWVQVLGVPIIGVIISVIGLRIAWLQKRLQDIRLQHDLYDRRFRIYGAAKGLLVSVLADGGVKRPAFQAFVEGTSDAEFLFASDVVEYLKQLQKQAARSIYVQTKLNDENLRQEDRGKFADEESKITNSFTAQFDVLHDKFRPFMYLEHSC